jgi:allantoin racemase
MRLLVLNANSTAAITDIVADAARRAASQGTEIVAATSRDGPAFIASRADNEAAIAPALAEARRHPDCDAVLIAASSDPGLTTLRAELPVPVVGMTEASAYMACMIGGRFGMLVFGRANVPIYREVIESYGLGGRLMGIEMLELPPLADFIAAGGTSTELDPPIIAAAERLIAQGADVVLLPSAALAPVAARIQPQLPVPILDGITCGVGLCEVVVGMSPKPSGR